MQSQTLWQGKPSPLMHLGLYLSCIFLLPLPFALWKYLATRTTSYQLMTERLVCQQGVFRRTEDEVELYRIKDYTVVAPLLYRWLGLADLVLITSDRTHPELVLKGINDAYQVKELIRTQVEALRTQKGVREID